jgi:hypothetical protein
MDRAAKKMILVLFLLFVSFGLFGIFAAGNYIFPPGQSFTLQSAEFSQFGDYAKQREVPHKPLLTCFIKNDCMPDAYIENNLIKSLLKVTSTKVPPLHGYEVLTTRNYYILQEMNLVPPSPPPRF